jgi:hypothetical protein
MLSPALFVFHQSATEKFSAIMEDSTMTNKTMGFDSDSEESYLEFRLEQLKKAAGNATFIAEGERQAAWEEPTTSAPGQAEAKMIAVFRDLLNSMDESQLRVLINLALERLSVESQQDVELPGNSDATVQGQQNYQLGVLSNLFKRAEPLSKSAALNLPKEVQQALVNSRTYTTGHRSYGDE